MCVCTNRKLHLVVEVEAMVEAEGWVEEESVVEGLADESGDSPFGPFFLL